MTEGGAPGRPEADTMLAPATFPASAVRGLEEGTFSSSAASMLATANGTLVRSVAPVTPVTTTSARRLMSRLSEKFAVCVPAVSRIGFDSGV